MARPPWLASLKPTHLLVGHGLVITALPAAAMSPRSTSRGAAAAAAAVEESLPPDLRGIALEHARGLVIVQLVVRAAPNRSPSPPRATLPRLPVHLPNGLEFLSLVHPPGRARN
jgi:hypothetical protein